MFGLNWVDAVIVVLLILAVVEGIRIGFVTQLFVVAGFFGTLFIMGWILPHLLPIHDATLKTVVNAALVLQIAAYAGIRSLDLGHKIHWSFRIGKRIDKRGLKFLETVFGSLPGLCAGLVLVWLLGVAIGRLPFAGLSNSANDSYVVQHLTHALPPVPAVFAEFNRQINPNAQPYVFSQPKPYTGFDYSVSAVQQAEVKAAPSLVRITGFGCGGIVSGSGFVVGPGLVATNAHVIAGIERHIIKYNGNSYEAVPVVFDSLLDLAVLRVPGLNAPSLPLATSNVGLDSTVAILGYPGGNYRVIPGIIRDTRAVSARSIYDQGMFGRGIYEVQATVDYGNSGGPLVLSDGRAAGIVFSKSTEVPDHAYALTSPHILAALHKAQKQRYQVSSGACMVQ